MAKQQPGPREKDDPTQEGDDPQDQGQTHLAPGTHGGKSGTGQAGKHGAGVHEEGNKKGHDGAGGAGR